MSLNRMCEEELNRLDAMLYMMLEAFGNNHDDIPADMTNNLYEYALIMGDMVASIRKKLSMTEEEKSKAHKQA